MVASETFLIETERLLLRPFVADDFDALHDMLSRPDVSRYLYSEPHTPDQTRRALERRIQETAIVKEGDSLGVAVVLRESGTMIGDGLLSWHSEQHQRGEIGYIFHPDFHGHGYATETVRELLRLGFETHGLRRLIGRCDARNTASSALMLRLGMRLEAHLRENEFVKGEWCDEQVYAMLAAEWRERAGAATG